MEQFLNSFGTWGSKFCDKNIGSFATTAGFAVLARAPIPQDSTVHSYDLHTARIEKFLFL